MIEKIKKWFKRYIKKQKAYIQNELVFDDNADYRKGYSFRSILLSLKKSFLVFIVSFSLITAASIYLGVMHSGDSYYSVASLSFSSYVYGDIYTTVMEDLITTNCSSFVISKMSEKGIHHKDNRAFSDNEIIKGISSTHNSDSDNIFITFSNYDETIVVPVVNSIVDFALDYYQDNKDGTHIKDFITLGSYASYYDKDVSTEPFYITLGTIGSLFISVSLSFIYLKIRGFYISEKDIQLPVSVLSLKKNKKQTDIDGLVDFVFNKIKENHTISLYDIGHEYSSADKSLLIEKLNDKKEKTELNIQISDAGCINAKSNSYIDDNHLNLLLAYQLKSSKHDIPYLYIKHINIFRDNYIIILVEE